MNEWMTEYKWMNDNRTIEQMNEWTNQRMNEWNVIWIQKTNEWLNERMNERTNERTIERIMLLTNARIIKDNDDGPMSNGTTPTIYKNRSLIEYFKTFKYMCK